MLTLALFLATVPPPPTEAASLGEKLPPGPPWHVTYRAAKREALRRGGPVFVYFTKSY